MNFPALKNLKFSSTGFSGINVLMILRRISTYVTVLLLFGMIGWLGYTWYRAVYAYEWTEAQKSEYRNKYAGETSFREERFTRTVETLKERIRLHQNPPSGGKDIFTGNAL